MTHDCELAIIYQCSCLLLSTSACGAILHVFHEDIIILLIFLSCRGLFPCLAVLCLEIVWKEYSSGNYLIKIETLIPLLGSHAGAIRCF